MNLVEMAKELLQIEVDTYKYDVDFNKYELITFTQIWPDTSCGWQSSVTLSQLSTQRVYVLFSCDDKFHLVYFGGEFAYAVKCGDETFENDLEGKHIAGFKDAIDRYNLA